MTLETVTLETMTQDLSAQGLLIMVASPNLEEMLVDVLLEMPEISGFTSSEVSGHGAHGAALSLMEQVTGRQKRIQFMVYGLFEDLQKITASLKMQFEQADIRYILIPTFGSQFI